MQITNSEKSNNFDNLVKFFVWSLLGKNSIIINVNEIIKAKKKFNKGGNLVWKRLKNY